MQDIYFIERYFTEEKIESIIFLILGIISIILALFFWVVIKYSLFNGTAYPLLLIGFIQIVVGTNIILRTPKDIERVVYMIKNTPKKIQTDEIPRMEKVIRNFKTYKILELGLILCGIVLYLSFFNSKLPFWKGLGLGLIIQSCIMFVLDLLAEDRAIKYIDELGKITSQY